MPIPTISALPVPPSSADPATFDARADAFLGALPTLRTQVNAATDAIPGEVYNTALGAGYAGLSGMALRAYAPRWSDFAETSIAPFVSGAINGGSATQLTGTNIIAGHPGVYRISSVATANSGGYISLGNAGSDLIRLEPGMRCEFVIRFGSAVASTTYIGWQDGIAAAGTPVDGLIAATSNNSSIQLLSYVNNSLQASPPVNVGANTWVHGIIEIVSASSATLSLYNDAGVLLGSVSLTAIPTDSGRELQFGVKAVQPGAAAGTLVDVDFLLTTNGSPLSRGLANPQAVAPERFSATRTITPQVAHALAAFGADANIGAALVPKGSGAITAAVPDGTANGGNARGLRALDLQLSRIVASQVASGNDSAILGGSNNTASGGRALVLGGSTNTASGINSSILNGSANAASGSGSVIIGGSNNTASGASATILGGTNNTASGDGSVVLSGSGVPGRNLQRAVYEGATGATHLASRHLLFITSSSGRLTTDSSGVAGPANVYVLRDSSAAFVRVKVIAYVIGSGATRIWIADACIKRGSGAASTVLVGTPNITSPLSDGLPGASVSISADTSLGALNITVNGGVAGTGWCAQCEVLEVSL